MATHEHRWLPGVAERLGYYVYLLIDPRDGRVFYVGKGLGDRCFQHIVEAGKTRADERGDYPKLRTIRAIEKAGRSVRIEVLRHGLDELTALIVEASGESSCDGRPLTCLCSGDVAGWVPAQAAMSPRPT